MPNRVLCNTMTISGKVRYYQNWLDTYKQNTYEYIKEALSDNFTLIFKMIDPYNTMTISGNVRYYQGWLDSKEAFNCYFNIIFNKIDPYNIMTISGKVRFYQS